MPIPVLGLPKFPSELDYQYSFTEELDQDVFAATFQSGISSRQLRTSHRRRTFTVKFKTVKESTMRILNQFYEEIGGPLKPFLFEPPIEKFDRYTQLVTDGSQILGDFEDGSLRAGNQSVVVRFTDNFSRTLFKPLLESTGLILQEVLGEDDKGKYIYLDGLLESQNASIADHEQDFLDLGTKDFMFDFLFRGETVFLSSSASYAGLTGTTLIFTIDGVAHTVTFTADAVDAASVVQEINDQQGDFVEAQVFGTTELKIRTVAVDGYFTISGTAFTGLDLAAPVIFPVHKHDGTSGYYFKQDGVGDLTFFIEGIWGDTATITADSSFHLLDGSFNFITVVIDRSGNGQIYVNGETSGAAVDTSVIQKTIDNGADFYLHKDANLDIDMDRVGVWSWDGGDLPSDIAARITVLGSDLFRIDNEDGLQVLYTFDKSDGRDDKQQEDLTLVNDPIFIDFVTNSI